MIADLRLRRGTSAVLEYLGSEPCEGQHPSSVPRRRRAQDAARWWTPAVESDHLTALGILQNRNLALFPAGDGVPVGLVPPGSQEQHHLLRPGELRGPCHHGGDR